MTNPLHPAEPFGARFPARVPVPPLLRTLAAWAGQRPDPSGAVGGTLYLNEETPHWWFGDDRGNDRLMLFANEEDRGAYGLWDDGAGHWPVVYLDGEGMFSVEATSFPRFVQRLLAEQQALIAAGYDPDNEDNEADHRDPGFVAWALGQGLLPPPSLAGLEADAKAVLPRFSQWVEGLSEQR